METKCHFHSKDKIKESLNFDCCVGVPSNGNCGGLMLFRKKDLDVWLMSFSVHIDVLISKSSWRWRFTGVYGHPVTERRQETWELLKRLHSVMEYPLIPGGNFNEITMDSKRWEGLQEELA